MSKTEELNLPVGFTVRAFLGDEGLRNVALVFSEDNGGYFTAWSVKGYGKEKVLDRFLGDDSSVRLIVLRQDGGDLDGAAVLASRVVPRGE
jgi:hypothetical protein